MPLLAGSPGLSFAAGVLILTIGLARPIRWSYHTALALSREAAARRPWIEKDLRAGAWFLALPGAIPIAWLVRRAASQSADPSKGLPLLSWAPEYLAALLAAGLAVLMRQHAEALVRRVVEDHTHACQQQC